MSDPNSRNAARNPGNANADGADAGRFGDDGTAVARVLLVGEHSGQAILLTQLRQQGVEAAAVAAIRLPAFAQEATHAGEPPTVCVFFYDDGVTMADARALREVHPEAQLVFITVADKVARLRRELRNAPQLDADSIVLAKNDAGMVGRIVSMDANARRQRKLRSTLVRANAQMAGARGPNAAHPRATRIAERYLHGFLEQADDAFIGLDNDGRVLYWNHHATLLFGLAAEEAIGHVLQAFAFWPTAALPTLDALRVGGGRAQQEFAADIGGQRHVLDIVFSPVHDENAELIGALLVVRDASQRHRAQQAERSASQAVLAQAEADRRHLATLFEAAPGFMAVTRGSEHVFEMANRAYHDTLGDRALKGRPLDAAFPDLTGQPFHALRDRVFATGEPFVGRNHPVRLRRSEGGAVETIYLDFVYQPIRDHNGAVTGIFCQGSDVTEQKLLHDRLLRHQDDLERLIDERTGELQAAQQALHQSQKLEAIGKLTGGVAHDFNNILQVIGSNLELLSLQKHELAASEGRIQSAIGAVARGARLASHLLAFARRQPLKPAPTSVIKIMQDMDDLLHRALGEAVDVEMIFGGSLWTAMVDRNQLENVLLNLAINARDAMDGAGKLTIEVGNTLLDQHYVQQHAEVAAGQYVMLAITDTGCGMTPEVLAHVFEPFYTTKKEGHGTGLGLSMAYGFVKQSGGHIKIYTEPGNGTTIKIYLPRSFQAEVAQPVIHSGPPLGGAETILVVEDDEAVQAVVVDQLTQLGYRVLRAGDAQAALSVLQSGIAVDLLFTDVVMPGPLRSADLARVARQMLPAIGVLFTSGYTQNAIVHGGRLDVDVELLSKPYPRDELARRVRQILDRQFEARTTPVAPAALRILVVEDNLDALETLCEMLGMMGHDARGVARAEDALTMLANIDVLVTDIRLPGMQGPALARVALQANPRGRIVFVSGGGVPTGLDYQARLLKKPFTFEDLAAALAPAAV